MFKNLIEFLYCHEQNIACDKKKVRQKAKAGIKKTKINILPDFEELVNDGNSLNGADTNENNIHSRRKAIR